MPLLLKLILLGIVQGLTEFLPVSSKGHLALSELLLGVHVTGDRGATVEIALHAGTVFAVLVFMRRDLLALLRALTPRAAAVRGEPSSRALLVCLIVATIPAGVVGLLFKDEIEKWFMLPRVTGWGFLFTAGILLVSSRFQHGTGIAEKVGVRAAALIGLAQVLAFIPGVSRSGTTIVAALLCSLSPREAARFSFLMSLPVTAGAVVIDCVDLRGVPADQLAQIGVGVLFSFLAGLAALRFLTLIAQRGRLPWFAAYLIPVGILTLLCFGRT